MKIIITAIFLITLTFVGTKTFQVKKRNLKLGKAVETLKLIPDDSMDLINDIVKDITGREKDMLMNEEIIDVFGNLEKLFNKNDGKINTRGTARVRSYKAVLSQALRYKGSYGELMLKEIENRISRADNILKNHKEAGESVKNQDVGLRVKGGKEVSALVVKPYISKIKKISRNFLKRISYREKLFNKIKGTNDSYTCTGIVPSNPSISDPALIQSTELASISNSVLELANKLETPAKMLSFVKNRINFYPSFGATQISDDVIISGKGTFIDKATLLISLLRAKGIPAEYKIGEIFIEEEKLKNLYGVESSSDLFWAHYWMIPSYLENEAEEIQWNKITYFREGIRTWTLPYAWVNAYVNGEWQLLDPTHFDDEYGHVDGIKGEIPYYTQFRSWLLEQDEQGRYVKPYQNIDHLMRQAGIIINATKEGTLDDYGLPYYGKNINPVINDLVVGINGVGNPCLEYQGGDIPDELKYKSVINIGPEDNPQISKVFTTATLKSRRLSLMHSSGLLSQVGAKNGYLYLKEGDSVIDAISINSGDLVNISEEIRFPTKFRRSVIDPKDRTILAGAVVAINHFVGPVSMQDVHSQISLLRKYKNEGRSIQQLLVSLLRLAGIMFEKYNTDFLRDIDKLRGMRSSLAEIVYMQSQNGIVVNKDDHIIGILPSKVIIGAISASTRYSKFGNYISSSDYKNMYNHITDFGIAASSSEHLIWEELFGIPGGSAVRVMQLAAKANSEGANIGIIDGELFNTETAPSLLSQLSPELSYLADSVLYYTGPRSCRGEIKQDEYELFMLKSPVSLDSGWKGAGFITRNIKYGGAALIYAPIRLASSNKGGGDQGAGQTANQSPVGTAQNSKNNKTSPTTSCPVVISSGSMWHSFVDFNIRGRTPSTNLRFERTYLTKLYSATGDLGANWTHNYDTRLIFLNAPGVGDIMWIDESGGEWQFTRNPDNSFTSPKGLYFNLTEYVDRYELSKKNGAILTFSRTLSGIPEGRLESIRDPHGEEVLVFYDGNGRLQSMTSALAGTFTIERYPDGKISRVVNERDNLDVNFFYNTDGKLSRTLDVTEKEERYEYIEDRVGTLAQGLLNKIIDNIGSEITFNYYDNGKVFEEIAPGDGVITYFYSPYFDRPITRLLGEDNQETEYRFDGDFRLIETVHPNRTRTQINWNDSNQVVSKIDELGFKTIFQYDSRGNQSGIKRPENSNYLQVIYDETFSIPTLITPLVGSPTTMTVDPNNGNITKIQRTDSQGTLSLDFTHDIFGNILQTTNNRGLYSNTTNENGQLTLAYNKRNSQTLTYDSRNRVNTRTFANGRTLTYTYNDYDMVTRVDDSHGPSVINDYDIVKRLILKTVTDGTTSQITSYEWDERNRLVAVTDPMGRRTETKYDTVGIGCTIIDKPTEITDPAGRITRMEYDSRSRLTRVVDPRGGQTRYEYNMRGDRIAITDSEGNRTRYRFDGNRRLIKRERPTVRTSNGKQIASREITNYHYNENNQIVRQEVELPTLQNGTYKGYLVTEYYYNELNQLSGRKQFKEGPGGVVLETYEDSNFTYHRQLDATLPLTANNEVTNLGFTYEATPPFAPTGYTVAAAQVGNPLNLIEGNFVVTPEVEAPIGTVAKDGTTLITRDYDLAGRLTNTNATFAGNILNTVIAHDSLGRKETITHSSGLVGTYAYDLLNRVTSIAYNGAGENFSEGITYDTQTGNITGIDREFGSFTYGYDSTNQLVSTAYAGATTLPDEIFNRTIDYDYAGNRTNDTANGETKSFRNIILENDKFKYYPDEDGLGRVIQKNSKTSNVVDLFKYRADGRLRTFKRYEGNLKTREVGYFYDAYGRRVAKELDINGSQFTNNFLHLVNNDKILLAQNGQGDQTLFIDGSGIDEHLGKIDLSNEFAFTRDHIGSVINGEAMAEKRVVGSFGENSGSDLVTSVSSAPIRYSFTGRPIDSEHGCQDNRGRTYCGDMGRFLSEDQQGDISSGNNNFAYVNNSPLRYVDPVGLDAYLMSRDFWKEGVPVSHNYIVIQNTEGLRVISYGVGDDGNLQNVEGADTHARDIESFQSGNFEMTRINASDEEVESAANYVNNALADAQIMYTYPMTGVEVYNSNTASQAVANLAQGSQVNTPMSSPLGALGAENAGRIQNMCPR